MPLVERSLIHDSDEIGEGENAMCRAWRLSSLFRTKLIPLAAAALLIALIVTRNEVSLVLRNGSDPGLSKHENLADLNGQQQLQQPSEKQELQSQQQKYQQQQLQQRQPQPMNSTAFNIALHEAQNPVNWTWRHIAEKQKTKRELDVLKRRFQSQIMKLKDADEILSYQELEKHFRPLLQEKGLLMVGDSTTRYLFGTLWCLMDRIFSSDGDNDWKVCHQRQKKMKAGCQTMMDNGEHCQLTIPTFANATTNLHLQFQWSWRIGKLPNNTVNIMADNRDRFIFYMMPCLHELWTPGGREKHVPEYPSWNSSFDDLFTSVEQANPAYAFLLGTAVAVCDSKLWDTALIKMYLEGKSFVNGEPRNEFSIYAYQGRANLSAKYSGPVPVLKSFRENHTCDNSLFDEGGVLKCTAVGLEVLSQHSLLTNPTVKILDMHDATKDRCNDTLDGRHYIRGLALRRQLTLLLKAMQIDAIVEGYAA